ncbi:hypothetical protein NXC24_PB00081 (plasmid) [Rhizobium sp. NXC24]|nr:hypothetical protein NXC24_PB00081 [Rhizobium sp. NXC24]
MLSVLWTRARRYSLSPAANIMRQTKTEMAFLHGSMSRAHNAEQRVFTSESEVLALKPLTEHPWRSISRNIDQTSILGRRALNTDPSFSKSGRRPIFQSRKKINAT